MCIGLDVNVISDPTFFSSVLSQAIKPTYMTRPSFYTKILIIIYSYLFRPPFRLELTYIVSSGALNSTHSLTRPSFLTFSLITYFTHIADSGTKTDDVSRILRRLSEADLLNFVTILRTCLWLFCLILEPLSIKLLKSANVSQDH